LEVITEREETRDKDATLQKIPGFKPDKAQNVENILEGFKNLD
jgi:hypothetical protein